MRQPKPIDLIIAKRLRQSRLDCGMTLQDVQAKIGVSYQQIQKYENASNRVSAGQLWHIAKIYNKPIDYFFEAGSS